MSQVGRQLNHFALDPSTASTNPGRFIAVDQDLPLIELVKGLHFRPFVGTNMLMNFVRYQPFTEAPLHAHSEEQITLVLEGEFEFEVAGAKRLLHPGDAVWIPSNVPHAARTFATNCYQVDVFSPPRQSLLDLLKADP